jgi:hypothetical protein
MRWFCWFFGYQYVRCTDYLIGGHVERVNYEECARCGATRDVVR